MDGLEMNQFLSRIRTTETHFREQITRLEDEKRGLENRELALQQRVKSLELECARIRAQKEEEIDRNSTSMDIAALKREFEDKIHYVEQEKDRAIKDAQDAQGAFMAKQSRIQELREQVIVLEFSLQEAQRFIEGIENKIVEIDQMKARVEDLARSVLDRASYIESTVARNGAAVGALKENHLKYTETIKVYSERLSHLDLEIKLKEQRIKKQDETISILEDRHSKDANQIQLNENQMKDLNLLLVTLRKSLQGATEENTRLRHEVSALSFRLGETSKEFDCLQSLINELRDRMDQQQRQHSAETNALKTRLEMASQEKDALANSNPQVEALKNLCTTLQDQLTQTRAREVALAEEQSVMTKRLSASQKDNDLLRSQLDSASLESRKKEDELNLRLRTLATEFEEYKKRFHIAATQVVSVQQIPSNRPPPTLIPSPQHHPQQPTPVQSQSQAAQQQHAPVFPVIVPPSQQKATKPAAPDAPRQLPHSYRQPAALPEPVRQPKQSRVISVDEYDDGLDFIEYQMHPEDEEEMYSGARDEDEFESDPFRQKRPAKKKTTGSIVKGKAKQSSSAAARPKATASRKPTPAPPPPSTDPIDPYQLEFL